jgi:hypothetical protein
VNGLTPEGVRYNACAKKGLTYFGVGRLRDELCEWAGVHVRIRKTKRRRPRSADLKIGHYGRGVRIGRLI